MKKPLVCAVICIALMTGCRNFYVGDVVEPFMTASHGEQKALEGGKGTAVDNSVFNSAPAGDEPEASAGNPGVTASPEPVMTPPPVDYESIKANEVGRIMIVMYHGIVESDPPTSYQRTADDFKKDLQALYDRGYRLISMKDLIENNIAVEAGKTPVVITFDDGLPSEFSFASRKEGGEYVPAEGCAVDIINKFCADHPDFGKSATFFVNSAPFGSVGTYKEKFAYLIDSGYDIGNHTFSHPYLDEFTKDAIEEELGEVDALIRENTDGYVPLGVAYPHGVRPVEELRYAVEGGEHNGKTYTYRYGLAVGDSGKSASPNHVNFDPMYLPRCRASEDDVAKTDLWGLIEFFDANPDKRYISDGNPGVIAVPEGLEEIVNKDSLLDKQLVLY